MEIPISIDHLLYACGIGDLEKASLLLDKGIHPDGQDSTGVTALHVAASWGNESLTRLLLEKGASVDLPNFYGWTPLLLASFYGHLEVARVLLNHKARANQPNKLGLRPLTAAAWGGHLPLVRLLLQYGAVLDLSADCPLSPLPAAAYHGHSALVRLLLDSGLPANTLLPHTGVTPLIVAAAADRQSIVQLLVEWGAEVNHLTINGHSALDVATTLSHHTVKAYLDDKTMTWPTPTEQINIKELMRAIKDDEQGVVKSLLSGNLLLCNAVSDDELTPLMYAAMLGRAEIVQLLIACGANLNQQDPTKGWTPLMHAVYNGHSSVVKTLLEAGAEVEIANHEGLMAFDLACLLDKEKTDIMALVARKTNSLTRTLSPKLRNMFQDPKRSFRTRASLKSNLKAWFQLKMPRHSSSSCSSSYSPDGLSPSTISGPRLIISSPKNLPSPSPQAVLPPVLPGPDKDIITMPGIRITPGEKGYTQRPNLKPIALLRKWKLNSQPLQGKISKYSNHVPGSSPNLSFTHKAKQREHESHSKDYLSLQKSNVNSESSSHNAVVALLEEMCLQKYIEKFQSQEIDLEAFRHLTESDLDELGVLSLQPRQSLLALIRQLKPRL